MNNDTNSNYYSNDHLLDDNGIENDLDIKIQDDNCNHNNNNYNLKTKNKKKKKNKKLSSSIDHNVDRYDDETEDYNAIFKFHSSRLFKINYTKDKGRYLISKVKIKKGMIIFNEKVYQSISHQQQLCCACHLIVDNNCNISNNNVNVKNHIKVTSSISSTITTKYNKDDNINTTSTSPNIINNNQYEDVSLPHDVFCSQQCKNYIYEHKNFKYYLEINQNLKKYAMDSKSDLDLLRMIVKIMLLYEDTEVDKDNNYYNNDNCDINIVNNNTNLTNSEDKKGSILSDDGVTIKATPYALDLLEHHLEKQSKEWIDSLNLAISYIYNDIQKVYMNDLSIITKFVCRYDNHHHHSNYTSTNNNHNDNNNSFARNYSLNSDDNDNYINRNPILIVQHDEDDDVTKQIYNYNSNHHDDKDNDIAVDNLLDEMCKKIFDPVRALKLASIININSYGIINCARHNSSSPSPSATSLISSSNIFSEAIGFGLFPIVGLLINHSCQPNCIYIYNNSTQCMEYHAIVDIDRNIEINVTYINIYQSIVDRRNELLFNRYFYCYCNRCCNYDNMINELEKKVTLINSSSSSIITTSNNYCNNDYKSSKGDDKNDNNYETNNDKFKVKSKNKKINIKNTNHDSIKEDKEEHAVDIMSIFTSPSSLSSTITTAKELSILNNQQLQQQQYCIVADAMFNGNHCNECGKYHQTMRYYYLILISSIFALIFSI